MPAYETLRQSSMLLPCGVEEGVREAQPLNSVNALEIIEYKNQYSVLKDYFRFKKLSRNRYFSRYRLFLKI